MNTINSVTDSPNFYMAASGISTMAFLTAYYVFNVSQVPKIYTSNGKLRDFLFNHVHSLQEKYWPAVFYWEGRLQSVLGLSQRLPSSWKLPYLRELVTLPDGGEVGLDSLEPPDPIKGEQRLIAILFPGLTSSSQTSYVKTLALAITKAGATIVIMNNRGLGGVPIKTNRLFCASQCDDARYVIAYLRKKYDRDRMIAFGTSLGGMILNKYLIDYPDEARKTFETAMVISTCWDAVNGVLNLEKPFINKYIVNYGMVMNLQYLTGMYRDVLESKKCDFKKIMTSRSLREFDSSFTAPHFGYESALEYYQEATIINNVHKFSIPVFGLNALDDPLAPLEALPIKGAEDEGSMLALIVTERGGHLGFLEGTLPFKRPVHFMERVVNEFVSAVALHGGDLKK